MLLLLLVPQVIDFNRHFFFFYKPGNQFIHRQPGRWCHNQLQYWTQRVGGKKTVDQVILRIFFSTIVLPVVSVTVLIPQECTDRSGVQASASLLFHTLVPGTFTCKDRGSEVKWWKPSQTPEQSRHEQVLVRCWLLSLRLKQYCDMFQPCYTLHNLVFILIIWENRITCVNTLCHTHGRGPFCLSGLEHRSLMFACWTKRQTVNI